jgi:diguanylate cyclase (GGDEF)-like protein
MLTTRRRSIVVFMIFAVGLVALSAGLLLRSETQRRRAQFSEYAQTVASQVGNFLDTNDAVLAGFSAFLQAVDRSDTESTSRYAAVVMSAYPHIYMIEVARAVSVADEDEVASVLRRTWQPEFHLKPFPGMDVSSPDLQTFLTETWPVMFMYPVYPQSTAIYGVRLETVPYLSHTLARTVNNTRPIASPVFEMYEGGRAYILMQSVRRAAGSGNPALPNFFGSTMVALLLIKTDAFVDVIPRLSEQPLVSVSAMMKTGIDAESRIAFQQADRAGWVDRRLLPLWAERVEAKSTSQPITLEFERQLRFADLLSTETLIVLTLLLAALIAVPAALVRHFAAISTADAEHQRAAYLATHDVLTQLPNRFLLVDQFDQALEEWRRRQTQFAVLLIDLDHFKRINDQHGHAVGDQVLQVIAARMLEATGARDTVARYGGDEFVVLMPHLLDTDSAEDTAIHVLAAIEKPIVTAAGVLSVSCSVGISICPLHGQDLDGMLKSADQAMYDVKQMGRRGTAMAKPAPQDV